MKPQSTQTDPTRGYNTFDEFRVSLPSVSRDQAEAIWEFFRRPKENMSASQVAEPKTRMGRALSIDPVAVAAIVVWIGVIFLARVHDIFAAVASIVAYGLSVASVYRYCQNCCAPALAEMPLRVSVMLVVWIALHILLFEIRDSTLLSLYRYAESHGWFVAVMFLWGIMCTTVFIDKVSTARAKATSLAFLPLLCFLAFGLISGALPEDGAGRFYFVGAILVGCTSIFVASYLAHELNARFIRRPPPSNDA